MGAIDRGPFNALIDDDGTNLIGTPWNKAAIKSVLLDPIDAAILKQPALVGLVDGPTVALDASQGWIFRLVATGDRTINPPTNGVNGQRIVIQHVANGGGCTLTLSGAAGGFRYGSDFSGLTATAANKTDYITCVYNTYNGANKWDVIGVTKGF